MHVDVGVSVVFFWGGSVLAVGQAKRVCGAAGVLSAREEGAEGVCGRGGGGGGSPQAEQRYEGKTGAVCRGCHLAAGFSSNHMQSAMQASGSGPNRVAGSNWTSSCTSGASGVM